jgi:hypothetical protein
LFTSFCVCSAAAFALAQGAPPTAYSITQAANGGTTGTTMITHRSGSKVVTELVQSAQGTTPASRTLTLYDLKAGTTVSWDPAANPPACSAGRFSGDWGDPFAMIADVNAGIAKGDLKPAGTETLAGVPARIYAGSSPQANMKVWVDVKDALVLRAEMSSPGAPPMRLVDISKVSLAAPAASLFEVPAACAGAKPPPTADELIADETGDSAANYANGMYGPGSKNSCSVVLRVVQAKTMTPIAHVQVAIDSSVYNPDHPSAYTFGVGEDGTTTYSGGSVREITNLTHNGVVKLGLPPAAFMLGVNLIRPHHGGSVGLVYRQCFAPTTVLLYVVKDYGQDSESGDFLWVKAGKNAAP